MITLTIVTVTKNDCKNLKKTLLSIKKNKTDVIEYIVIDGDSEDKTKNLLDNNSDIIDKSISEKDRGIYDAMNKGLKLASGRYVMFLNSGDELRGVNRVTSDIGNIDLMKCPTLLYGSEFSWSDSLTKVIFPKFRFCQMPTSHQAMIFNTNKARFYNYNIKYKFSADYELYLKIFKEAQCGVLVSNKVIVKTAPVGFTKTAITKYLNECYHINLEYNNHICSLLRYLLEIGKYQIKNTIHLLLNESIILRIRRIRGRNSWF